GVGRTRVVVDSRDRVMRVTVDGTAVPSTAGDVSVADGAVRVLPGTVQVRSDDGHLVTVTHGWGQSMDLTVGLTESGVGGGVVGLMGNADGDPADDLQTRDGQVLTQPVTDDELYA